MKKKVLVRGPLLSQSGYGNHARQVVKWLLKRDDFEVMTQVLHWGITPWHIKGDVEDGLIGEIMNRSIMDMPTGIDITYQVQLPHEWDPTLARINVGVTAAVETDICTPEWVEACNRMTAVVVPSNFTKATLERSGKCTTPITVIPESYIPEISQDNKPLPVDFSTDFNFLLFGMLTGQNPKSDRKNLFYTIKWILEEFKDNPDVGIVLKTSSGRGTKIDKKVTMKLVSQVIKEVREGPYPRVHFMHGCMTNSEVASIYKHPKIKALVALTRGEGYGLPILEAAASDLPVVATNWSGHLDFMNKGKFIAVDYTMQQIDQTRADDHIFLRHARWAEPSEKDAKKRLRKLYESYTTPKQWATSLGKKLREDLSHDKICHHWDAHLAGMLE
tara:strand:+ start:490 stop:1653 length:1164 start_codon:yes stop_codon:yes gene_type:complete